MSIFSHFQERFEATRQEEYSLQEYLDLCKQDKTAYASAAERLLMAIGEPELLDTSVDSRLSRIFSNKVIRRYPAFADFHGMEECIDQIVAFFRHAAQGLEEKKQILYLLGPVGGGKSSLAEKLKQLMEKVPFYAIKGSPVFESPLGLFNPDEDGAILEEDYGIPRRYLRSIMSPWATKRLNEFGGDISQFRVVKLYPSILNQIAIAKTEPGDENNQDISALVGKVDIRKLEEYPQNDADAYSYSGALCRANQGLMEFVEMFKAPIKVLHLSLIQRQQLQQHRRSRRPALQRHHPGSLQRIGMAQFPQQQEQRGLHRPHLHRQGAVLPARGGRDQDLRQVAGQQLAGACPLRAGHPEDALAVLRAVEAERAGKLEYLLEDAGI